VNAEVERLLGSYVSPQTDARAEEEMVRIIRSGMKTDQPLPEMLPPVHSAAVQAEQGARRGRRNPARARKA
jgi:hypothetical protein